VFLLYGISEQGNKSKVLRSFIFDKMGRYIKENILISFTIFLINPLKTKRVCFIQGLSAYRAVNTLEFGYKNQSLNVL
jgi:hypothetical protein